jgi:hydroxymethylpyrimidine pyrophosphatase-like HAD family hydrolase
MKISFDFDGTLTENVIKETAKSLIDGGHDVWIITARCKENYNTDLYKICEYINLPLDKVIYTNGDLKYFEYKKGNFDLHYDDAWDEVMEININGGNAILINPDFEEIYMEMQYEKNDK